MRDQIADQKLYEGILHVHGALKDFLEHVQRGSVLLLDYYMISDQLALATAGILKRAIILINAPIPNFRRDPNSALLQLIRLGNTPARNDLILDALAEFASRVMADISPHYEHEVMARHLANTTAAILAHAEMIDDDHRDADLVLADQRPPGRREIAAVAE